MKTERFSNYSSREAAVYTFAAIGFISLVGGGMWLAVYSSRFVPETAARLGEAAVVFSSFFTPATSTLSVIPTASSTLPFEMPTSSEPVATPVKTPITPSPTVTHPSAGATTENVFPIGGGTGTPSHPSSGLPDLIASITSAGYLTSTSTESFVATSTIPVNNRVAIKFIVTNNGGSPTGPWRFSVSIPTDTGYIFESPIQQSLGAGDRIEYILGFDQARRGTNQTISVSTDYDNRVTESNETNNGANISVTVLGN